MLPKTLLALAVAAVAQASAPSVLYQDPAGRFALRVPAEWRQSGGDGRVKFFGPPSGLAASSASLSVTLWSGSAQDYWASVVGISANHVTPMVEQTVAGRRAYFFWSTTSERKSPSGPTRLVTTKFALVLADTGLLVVAASSDPAGALAVDDALGEALSSLQIK